MARRPKASSGRAASTSDRGGRRTWVGRVRIPAVWAAGGGLLFLTTLFFLPVFLHPRRMLWGSDIVRAHSAYKWVQWRAFHVDGVFPLWDPTLFCGKSIVGDPLPALLNLPAMVFWLTPSPILFGYYLWFVVAVSAWGAFLLARRVGCDATEAFFAAAAFALSGKTAMHVYAGHVELLSTLLGLPWLLWAAERLREGHRSREAVLLGGLLAFTATFGSVQAVYWHVLFLAIYLSSRRAEELVRRRAGGREALRDALGLGMALGVFACAAAAWWFPVVRQTWLLSARRGAADFGFATMASAGPRDLLRWVWPFYETPLPRAFASDAEMGFFWETGAYPGVATLALATIAAVVLWKRRGVVAYATLALLAVLFAMGAYTPLYRLAYAWVPGFSLFRVPGRLFFYALLPTALLAGLLLSRDDEAKPRGAVPFGLAVLWQPVFIGTLVLGMGRLRPDRGLWVPLLVLTALSAASFHHLYCGGSRRLWRGVCLAALAAELYWVWQPHVVMADPKDALPDRPLGRFLAERRAEGPFRIYDPTRLIDQQDAARYGLELITGYHPGIYAHHLDLYKRLWGEDDSGIVELRLHPAEDIACPTIADLMNVKYVVSDHELAGDSYEEVYRTGPEEARPPRFVYRRTSALPRAWLTARAQTPPPGLSVADALCTIDPRTVCLTADRPVDGTAAFRELTVERRAPGDQRLRFRTDAAGVAVLSESWHPDWCATDRGKPVEVRRVNHAQIGVAIEPGDHDLHVYYHPWDFYGSAVVSVATWISIAAWGLWRLRGQTGRPAAPRRP